MPSTGYDVYNLRNIVNAAGSFRFCEGPGLTRAQALLGGWRDAGHVLATDISPAADTSEHKYCRLGKLGTDKKYVTGARLEFGIKCEEMTAFIMGLTLMGAETGPLTQAAIASATTVDAFAFTPGAPANDANTWYNLTQSGTQKRELATVSLTVPARPVTCDPATATIALTAHGWVRDTPIQFAGATPPSGLAPATTYYVINPTANDFQMSATVGGAAAEFSTAGSGVTAQQVLADNVGAIVDFKVGAVRFLHPVTQTVTVSITCPAIDANNHPASLFQGINVLQNPTRTGYCRLLLYADESPNKLVGDYIFKGQISPKGANGLDATKAAQFDFTITVLDDPGVFYVAP